jgi:hypothetical protein
MPASAGAIVMATGIVSVALHLDGVEVPSRVLLVLAAVAWVLIVAATLTQLRRAVGPGALTIVAGTAVLGTRIAQLGWSAVAIVFLVLAASAWPWLMFGALRSLGRRVTGEAYLLVVAPEGLAVLACVIADLERVRWLLIGAIVLGAAGIALYPLILSRFDLSNLTRGEGEQWVAGGSLAISTLAVSQIARTGARLGLVGGHGLRDAGLVLWVAAMLWLVPLVLTELLRPRVHYSLERWAMVFPLGMYAVCSFTVASVSGAPAIADFARVWTWVALAGWVAVCAAAVRQTARSGAPAPPRVPANRES